MTEVSNKSISLIIINDDNKELFISKAIDYECYIKQRIEIIFIINGQR